MKTHPVILGLSAVILSILFTLVVLELGLRFFPVQTYLKFEPVTASSPVMHFKPGQKFTYSAGWNFDAKAKGQINAQGWVNDQDYQRSDKPVIAIIGDSYIEAKMVEHDQTIQGRLQDKMRSAFDIYSFGIGGSPLSQYLIFAAHARDTYKPAFMIINIVGNDFDESLPQYKNKPRFHYFVPDKDEVFKPQLIGEYIPSKSKTWLAHSALVRYIYFHLHLADAYNKFLFKKRSKEPDTYVGNVEANASKEKIEDSRKAIAAFLNLLPSYAGLPKNRIILVIDGIRTDIYNDKDSSDSYFGKMRAEMIGQAQKNGFFIIDMQQIFARHYAENGQKFEFKQDSHWNALAHELAAQQIIKAGPFRKFAREKVSKRPTGNK